MGSNSDDVERSERNAIEDSLKSYFIIFAGLIYVKNRKLFSNMSEYIEN